MCGVFKSLRHEVVKNQVFATKQDDVLTAPPADTKKEAETSEAVRAAEQVDDE